MDAKVSITPVDMVHSQQQLVVTVQSDEDVSRFEGRFGYYQGLVQLGVLDGAVVITINPPAGPAMIDAFVELFADIGVRNWFDKQGRLVSDASEQIMPIATRHAGIIERTPSTMHLE